MRPAILDKNEHLVNFFTLKKAINLADVLSDISILSMQASLKQISSQIEDVGRDVMGMIGFARRKALSNKFIYARDGIMLLSTADSGEQEEFLKEADTYLMQAGRIIADVVTVALSAKALVGDGETGDSSSD